ncbi:MAG: four helix bundle protein [Chitinophagaceae bacterium]|nr:four helix bundle protein [Chitinophagaceae bacterium]
MITKVTDLSVYVSAHRLAMEIFAITRNFPKEERYSLTDQLTRSSRSIAANIAEGWGKRVYENEFRRHLTYAIGSMEETRVWLLFSRDCKYISSEEYTRLITICDEIGAKLYKLYKNWKTF